MDTSQNDPDVLQDDPNEVIVIRDNRPDISPSRRLHYEIEKSKLVKIIGLAKKENINPYIALGIMMGEGRPDDYGVNAKPSFATFHKKYDDTNRYIHDKYGHMPFTVRDDIETAKKLKEGELKQLSLSTAPTDNFWQADANLIRSIPEAIWDEYIANLKQRDGNIKESNEKIKEELKNAVDINQKFDISWKENYGDNIDREQMFISTLKEKLDVAKRLGYGNDEVMQYQTWNGLGNIPPDNYPDERKKYNLGNEPVPSKQYPFYGWRMKDLQDRVLKTNPVIKNLIGY